MKQVPATLNVRRQWASTHWTKLSAQRTAIRSCCASMICVSVVAVGLLALSALLTSTSAAAPPPAGLARPLDTDVSGVITQSTTWGIANSPYTLSASVIVTTGVKLTIEPGVVVQGNSNTDIRVLGRLEALGTPSQPILFTSASDNGPSQWQGLIFDGGTGHLRYTTVRYGGNNSLILPYGGSNIAVHNVLAGQVRIESSRIISGSNWQIMGQDHGLYVENSHVTVSDTLFSGNGNSDIDYPLFVTGPSSVVTLTGNTFTDNFRNQALLSNQAMLTANTLVPQTGLESYELANTFTIFPTMTLTVQPGVTVKGRPDIEIKVLGHLEALGTPSQPIIFTSATDNGPFQWGGLVFDGGSGKLRHVTVRYGGNGNSVGKLSNITIRNVLAGQVNIESSRIISASHWQIMGQDHGLYVENSHVTVSDTLFSGNGNSDIDYPLFVTGPSSVVTLTGNIIRGNWGGVYVGSGGRTTLRNNVIMDDQGTALYIVSGGRATSLHSTFARNSGNGVYVENGSTAVLTNTIVYSHTVGVQAASGATVTLTQTLWDHNSTNTVGIVNETGHLEGPASFDLDGYHLTADSMAVDRGVDAGVTDDIDGDPRPQGHGYDLGADEFASISPYHVYLPLVLRQ